MWVERPDLHASDALLEQRLREFIGAVQESIQVFVRPARFSIEAPVLRALPARGADVAVPRTGVVRADRVAARATENLIERLAGELAEEVPERDVEGGRSARLDARAAKAEIAGEPASEAVDLERIAAKHARRDVLVQVRLDARGGIARLAQPG